MNKTGLANPYVEDVQAFRKLVQDTPDLWKAMGDLASVSLRAVLDSFPPAARISIEIGVEEIKRDYGYDGAPSLEKTLIDQVIISWAQLQKIVIKYEASASDQMPLPLAALWGQKLNGAMARYLKSIDVLGKLRKYRGADADPGKQRFLLILDDKPSSAQSPTPESQALLPPPGKRKP